MKTVYGGSLKEKGNKDVWAEIKVDAQGVLIEKDGSPLFTINMLTEEVIKHEAPSVIECSNCGEIQKIDIFFEDINYQCICDECGSKFNVYKREGRVFAGMPKE